MSDKSFIDMAREVGALRQRVFLRPFYRFDHPDKVFFRVNDEEFSAQLKPCPFCGGEAEYKITPEYVLGDEMENHYIQCKSCLASTMRVTVSIFNNDDNIYGTIKMTIINLAEHWNRRTTA